MTTYDVMPKPNQKNKKNSTSAEPNFHRHSPEAKTQPIQSIITIVLVSNHNKRNPTQTKPFTTWPLP